MQSGGVARPLVRRLAGVAAVGILGFAICWALRLAWSDHLFHRDTPASVRQAVQLAPGNAGYLARLHNLDPAAHPAALRQALRLNPRHSAGWIEMGIQTEMDGDLRAAETFLLEAAKIDRTYDPRWALANFYLRRQDWSRFWPWMRRAVEMAGHERSPLYALCWRAADDPDVILNQAIPNRPSILAEYLNFLMATGRLDAAGPVAKRLSRHRDPVQAPVLLAYCDRLLEAGRGPEAVAIWNGLSAAGILSHRTVAPARAASLTNGAFADSPIGHGFDWRFLIVPGVSVARSASPPFLRITFSGRQPEQCRLLEQFLPLEPSRAYQLRFRYRTESVPPDSGLRWSISAGGRELAVAGPDLASADWREDGVTFSIPAEVSLARLALTYKRAAGTTRINGSVYLSKVALAFGN